MITVVVVRRGGSRTDLALRKDRALSTLLRCWNIPRPLSRLCQQRGGGGGPGVWSGGWGGEAISCGTHVRELTRRCPLITSSRSSSLEPSRRSWNRSWILEGGLLCQQSHSCASETTFKSSFGPSSGCPGLAPDVTPGCGTNISHNHQEVHRPVLRTGSMNGLTGVVQPGPPTHTHTSEAWFGSSAAPRVTHTHPHPPRPAPVNGWTHLGQLSVDPVGEGLLLDLLLLHCRRRW